MLTLLLGTDWVSNRQEILSRIAADVTSQKYQDIFIVPELISHDTERRLCRAAGDTCSRFAEVLTFTRLAKRVSDAAGHGAQECLDAGGRVVAMASAARQLKGKLKAYASVETNPEFLMGLVDAVDEFKRCCIRSEDLMSASEKTDGAFSQKLQELSLLLSAYDAICSRGKRDPRDQMSWVLEQLETCTFAQDHHFYIDGFPDFTRQHMAVIEHLIAESSQVTISMTCDSEYSSKLSFEKAAATTAALIKSAKKIGSKVEIVHIPSENTEMSFLCQQIFQGRLEGNGNISRHLTTVRTETVYDECAVVADKILDYVQNGARFRDMSVVCADMATYQKVLPSVFSRCHIPCYLSGTEDILEKPVIMTVLSALDAALGGFEQRDVLLYLKSMLSPLDLSQCDQIENYAIVWNISGSRWMQQWKNHPSGLGEQWDDQSRACLDELNAARQKAILPLINLAGHFHEARNLKDQVEALNSFLEEIHLSDRLAEMADQMDQKGDNRSAQILNQLWEILLNALEQLYDVLGDSVWDGDTFTRLLRILLSQYDVGTIPSVLDSVTVGPVSAMRCQQAPHLFILGAVEGHFPGYAGASGILTDQERVALRNMGVSLTGGSVDGLQAEFAEIYGVFCGAQETIHLSCPGGQPSFIYNRMRDLLGKDRHIDEIWGAIRSDPCETAAFLSRKKVGNCASFLGILDDYERIQKHKAYKLGTVSRAAIEKLYGTSLKLSASQIDRQAECRMSYFLKYGMRAKERKPVTVDPAEFGTYVHAVLEQTGRKVMEMGGFHRVTLDQVQKMASDISDLYAKDRFSEIDSERLSYLFRRNTHELSMVVRELWEELQQSCFEPVDFEVGFGDHEDLHAIAIPGKTMNAWLRGFVDRVDVWQENGQNFYRVVDYKTGKKDFDYCDVFNGIGLQMLLYLFALEKSGSALLGEHPIPVGVQYFPARAPYMTAEGILSAEEADEARLKLWKRKGLLLEDEQVLEAMEPGEPVRMCYSRKKDGSISGDIADRRQFHYLKAYVFTILQNMVDDIASGCVAPNPYTRGNSHNACTFCPYGEVCHPNDVQGRRNYKTMTRSRFWEEVEAEVKKGGR